MNDTALDAANIDNLTRLWRAMGSRDALPPAGLQASTRWPHRYWFDWHADTDRLQGLEQALRQIPPQGIVPVWQAGRDRARRLEQQLIDGGFNLAFEQTAMVLDLADHGDVHAAALTVATVQRRATIETWTHIASEAFGYAIDTEVIQRIAGVAGIELLLGYCDTLPAATALLYHTGEITGVHQVGVARAFQGRGVASALMQHIIERSIARQGRYLTLQASAEGEPLYRKLQFRPQFRIRNYQRPDGY